MPIYEVGQVGELPYFSMRLVEGGNLTRHTARLKENPRAAAALMVKVARAVHYAHQRAILHRDIKPSNVLLDRADEPYVTDFGLAKRIEGGEETAPTLSGAVMGTPAYMPPEQARGDTKRLTTAADIYSLGATLYETVTGRAPFLGDSPAVILRQVLDQEPTRPSALNARVDHDLETICLKCLAKEPERRYGTAEDLAEDLQRWLDGLPIQARRVRTWERAWKWARRRPAVAGLWAFSAVALLTLAGVITGYNVQLRKALHLSNQGRYTADISLAHRAYEDREVYRARELLGDLRPRHGAGQVPRLRVVLPLEALRAGQSRAQRPLGSHYRPDIPPRRLDPGFGERRQDDPALALA